MRAPAQASSLAAAGRIVAALVLAVTLAACASGESVREPQTTSVTPEPDTTASAPPADPSPEESPEPREAITEAYLSFWDVLREAGEPPDPDHPALDEVAADPQLGQLREVLSEYRSEGVVRREIAEHSPEVTEVSDGVAVVEDCMTPDPESGLYDAETGERVSEEGRPGQRQLLEVQLELIDGSWKVVNVNVVEEDSSCEPDSV